MTTEMMIAAGIGFGVGLLICWLAMRARLDSQQERLESGRKRQVEGLQVELDEQKNKNAHLQGQLEKSESAEEMVEAMKQEMSQTFQAAASKVLKSSNEQFLTLANEKLGETMKDAQGELKARHEQFKSLSKSIETNNKQFLETANEKFGKTMEEAQGELKVRHEQLKSIGNAIESGNKKALALANENFGKTLTEAKGEIKVQHEQLQALVKPLAQNYEKLNPTIESLTTQSRKIEVEANKLSQALTDNRRAGHWGEVQLKRVVELAGMSDYCDFAEQEGSGLGRPDMTVKLPEGRTIVVDAKASMSAFMEARGEQDPAAADKAWKNHAENLKRQVDNLAGKNYIEEVDGSLDFVAMFVPGDQFLAAALSANPNLADYAIQRRIVLVTPASLIAMLWAVANGWRQQQLSEKAEEIRQVGEEMHKRMMTFIDHYEKVGRQLGSAVVAFDKSVRSYKSRLEPQGRKFSGLLGKDEESLSPPETIDALPDTSKSTGEED